MRDTFFIFSNAGFKNTIMILQKHIDGNWYTSEYEYKEFPIQIKMRDLHGCKVHIWNKDKTEVLKTFRFSFATVDYLLNKAKNHIDKIIITTT